MSSVPLEEPPIPAAKPRHWIVWALACWLVALVLTFAGFVAVYHSGPWFANNDTRSVRGEEFKPARGAARVEGGAIVLERPGEDGSVIVSTNLDPFDASLYRFARVRLNGAYPAGGLVLVWRSDRLENKVNRLPVISSGGRILPVTLTAVDGWSGKISGLGLIARGPLAGPLAVERIELEPSSVWTTVDSMVSDWLEFEPWDGGSIHFMSGGNPSLRYPLPFFLGVSFLVAVALYLGLVLLGNATFAFQVILAMALFGWMAIDARWQLNLWRQLDITRFQYAGKNWEDKRRAAEDGALFEFMRAAKEKIGKAPAHVFIFSEDEFERVRGAYHLYPLNVHVRTKVVAPYPPQIYKPGDVIVMYRKRGTQYVPSTRTLRWDGAQEVRAELLLFSEGSGVFRVLPPA
jgi:hypothetical protein